MKSEGDYEDFVSGCGGGFQSLERVESFFITYCLTGSLYVQYDTCLCIHNLAL